MLSGKAGKTMAFMMAFAMVATVIAVFPVNDVSGATIYTITGIVRDDVTGEPIVGVDVAITNSFGVSKADLTDATGTFVIYVGDNTNDFNIYFNMTGYTDEAYEPGITFADFNTTTDTAVYDELLVPLSKVGGTIMIKGTYLPLYEVQVTITDSMETYDPIMTGTDGKFSQYVNDGDVDITYERNGYYFYENSVTVTENTDIEVSMEKIVPEPTIEIRGSISDVDGNAIAGAKVSISSGDDKWISTKTTDVGYYSMMAYPGSFQIKAEKEGFETNINADDNMLVVPSDAEAVWRAIEMVTIPTPEYTVTGTVTDGTNPIVGATVTLVRTDGKYETSTDTDGVGDFDFLYNGTFSVVVEMDDYFTQVLGWNIDNTNDTDVIPDIELTAINNVLVISGFIGDEETQKAIEGADVTLYDNDHIYTLSESSSDNGYYEFNVHNFANFTMVVDADGYQSEIFEIMNIQDSMSKAVWLKQSPKDTITTEYTFVDWTDISVVETTTLIVDNISKRVEIDRMYGRGLLGLGLNNWDISTAEVDDWAEYLKYKGLENKDTAQFLTLDDVHYELSDAVEFIVTVEEALGSVITSSNMINITKTYNYTISDETLLGDDSVGHTLFFGANYDTDIVDMNYEIYLPAGFEMTSSLTETTSVMITGYNDPIMIDTEESPDLLEEITMTLEASEAGNAVAFVSNGLFYELNTSAEGYDVIVSAPQDGVNTELVFSAESSTDPIGDITAANFTWDFIDDGNLSYGMTTKYNYTTAGNYVVPLEITETGGDVTTIDFDVKVDGRVPISNIGIDTTVDNVTLSGTTLTVNQGITITFDGLASYDDVAAAGDKLGVIESWFWVWGDDSTNETITMAGDNFINKTYSTPGQYTLEMTTTDVVGHESVAKELTVIVKDTAAPLIMNILMYDENMVEINDAVQDMKVYLSANDTTDADDFEDLVFSWDFDNDGVDDANGSWISTTFSDIGDVNVTLTATDSSGNSKESVRVINVRIGESANLLLMAATFNFDPETGTKGKATTITVNITNNGELNATGVGVKFYIRDSDGNDAEMDGTVSLKVNGVSVTTIAPGDIATASISWKPSSKGTYTIWANVTTESEHSSQYTDNNNIGFWEYSTYTVEESDMLIYGIIAIIVIGGIGAFVGAKFITDRKESEPKSGDKKKRK